MENIELSQQKTMIPKKDKRFLYLGVIVAIINIASRFLTPSSVIFIISQITVITIIVSIIFSFTKKYRHIGRQYLIGLWGTLLGLIIIGFTLTFILIAIKK